MLRNVVACFLSFALCDSVVCGVWSKTIFFIYMDFQNIKIFQGLNGLRFFAALLVVMQHSETIKRKHGIANWAWLNLFQNGGNAVTFFFVLSGFLITYLLLKEARKTNDISIKNFYIKRVLRIWPLYFLLVFIGAIALPIAFSFVKVDYEMPYTIGQTWAYFVFFVPGLVTFYWGHHFLEPLWSIGIEECFYLIWAPLFKFLKKNILPLLLSVLSIVLMLNVIGCFWVNNELYKYLLQIFRFEAMAIGGLGAYFLYTKGNVMMNSRLFSRYVQIIFLMLFFIYIGFNSNINNIYWNLVFKTPIFSSFLIDFIFLYLILAVSVAKERILTINNKFLNYLGDISYGVYMYHLLAISIAIFGAKKHLQQMGLLNATLVFYLIVVPLTIIIAGLSKKFFENYFLRMKEKYIP